MKFVKPLVGLVGGVGMAFVAHAALADDVGLSDMVEIMREEGVIDDGQYAQMKSKAEKREAKKSWTERLQLWGDARLRYEGFVYDKDAFGDYHDNRGRFRYRLRLDGKGEINDHVDAFFRLATGDDNRSTNQTLGGDQADFDPDGIFVDLAYLTLTPWADGALPRGESGYLGVDLGKVKNPYFWSKSISPDYLLWDRDITLEGGNLRTDWDVARTVNLFLNGGYYVDKENSSGGDPGLMAAQLGTHVAALDWLQVGGRVSYYGFTTVDEDFLNRGMDDSLSTNSSTDGGGNQGIVGGPYGLTNSRWINVLEGSVYATFSCLEDWPITIFGNVSGNLSAQAIGMLSEQELAWMAGVQAGDKKKYVNVGLLYGYIEADAMPSQFIDSDLLDGRTNRRGFAFWVARQLAENISAKVELFKSHEIEKNVIDPQYSVVDARRWRMRADLEVKF